MPDSLSLLLVATVAAAVYAALWYRAEARSQRVRAERNAREHRAVLADNARLLDELDAVVDASIHAAVERHPATRLRVVK